MEVDTLVPYNVMKKQDNGWKKDSNRRYIKKFYFI